MTADARLIDVGRFVASVVMPRLSERHRPWVLSTLAYVAVYLLVVGLLLGAGLHVWSVVIAVLIAEPVSRLVKRRVRVQQAGSETMDPSR